MKSYTISMKLQECKLFTTWHVFLSSPLVGWTEWS